MDQSRGGLGTQWTYNIFALMSSFYQLIIIFAEKTINSVLDLMMLSFINSYNNTNIVFY